MKMSIGLISDTHGEISKEILDHLGKCDEIWHAGDWGPNVYEKLLALKIKIRGVYGNIDGTSIRSLFKEEIEFTIEGCRVYMTHIGGKPGLYPTKIKQKLKEIRPDLYICGHSHILKIIYDKQQEFLHINPGACGSFGFHTVKTFLLFDIENKTIKNMRIIEYNKN